MGFKGLYTQDTVALAAIVSCVYSYSRFLKFTFVTLHTGYNYARLHNIVNISKQCFTLVLNSSCESDEKCCFWPSATFYFPRQCW